MMCLSSFSMSSGSTCVDPNEGGTHRMTSDEFFVQCTNRTFDLIFVDGLHTANQAMTDIINALAVLSDGGTIVIHDLNPRTEVRQLPYDHPDADRGIWNGDVWKVTMVLRQMLDLDLVIVDVDHGVGVLRVTPNTRLLPPSSPLLQTMNTAEDPLQAFSYEDLDEHREEMLPLVSMLGLRLWLAAQEYASK